MHTVSLLVENKPGALARVSNMFARRGYNIESLAVGPTERPDVSRISHASVISPRGLPPRARRARIPVILRTRTARVCG